MLVNNYQCVWLFLADAQATPSAILRGKGYRVQYFGYDSKREHNYEVGSTYHQEDATIVNVTLRQNTSDAPKPFLEQMSKDGMYSYSFLFNPKFNTFGRLESMDDAMVVNGYIVDVEEEYIPAKGDIKEQMLMHVQLLVNSIIFVGEDKKSLTLKV